MEKARQMLKDTDYPVAKISNQLGFGSESYFIVCGFRLCSFLVKFLSF